MVIRNEAETSNVYLGKKAKKLGIDIEQIVNRDGLVITGGGLYIVNLAPSYEEGGTHWTALYVDQKDRWAMYYDSLGVVPPLDVIRAVETYKRGMPLYYNTQQVQSFVQGYCGQHTLWFGYYLDKINRSRDPVKIISGFLKGFNAEDLTKNDDIVRANLKRVGFYNS
jgi:hypothetical protein